MLNSILGARARLDLPLAATVFVMVVAPASAYASLGGHVATVETDRAEMQGSRNVTSVQGYSVHELKAPTGTVVREFVSAEGTVFAVAWQGPFMPNLRQLLGDYFEPFSLAARAKGAHRPGRRPLLVRGPGFVVESSGRMRALFGRAYLPERLPAAISEEGIR
jgi:Protein of unknown function (DUF2844)